MLLVHDTHYQAATVSGLDIHTFSDTFDFGQSITAATVTASGQYGIESNAVFGLVAAKVGSEMFFTTQKGYGDWSITYDLFFDTPTTSHTVNTTLLAFVFKNDPWITVDSIQVQAYPVFIEAVPIPAPLWLLGSALIMLGLICRRKAA